jgi:hypothetical protein
MTLSVSRARQWAIKLFFALLIALILGILMPALAWFAAKIPNIKTPGEWQWSASIALLAAVCSTVLSFWSVTMFGAVVRAVLFALLGAAVFLFGGSMMLRIGSETGLLQGFYSWLIVEFQLPPYGFASNWIIAAGWFVGLSLLLVLLLRQSYVHCRREPSPGAIIRCSLILVIALFLPLWLSSDLAYSFWSPEIRSLRDNLGEAILKLPASIKEEAIEKSNPVSIKEIESTNMLRSETRRWLRGASVQIGQPFALSPQSHPVVQIGVAFPNGRRFETVIPW